MGDVALKWAGRRDAFPLGDLLVRTSATRHEIVDPPVRTRDGFDQLATLAITSSYSGPEILDFELLEQEVAKGH